MTSPIRARYSYSGDSLSPLRCSLKTPLPNANQASSMESLSPKSNEYFSLHSVYSWIKDLLFKSQHAPNQQDAIIKELFKNGLPPASEENKLAIHNLLEEIATKPISHLALNNLRLSRIGENLRREVHPYRFLAEIFSNPETTKHMKAIYENQHILSGRSQIWSNFVYNLKNNFIKHEADTAFLAPFFAKDLNINLEQVEQFEHSKNWEELLTYLINLN